MSELKINAISKASSELSQDPKFSKDINDKFIQNLLKSIESNSFMIDDDFLQNLPSLLGVSSACRHSEAHKKVSAEVTKLIAFLLRKCAESAVSLNSICCFYEDKIEKSSDIVIKEVCTGMRLSELRESAIKSEKNHEEIRHVLNTPFQIQDHQKDPNPPPPSSHVAPPQQQQPSSPAPQQSPQQQQKPAQQPQPQQQQQQQQRQQQPPTIKQGTIKERAEAGDPEAMYEYSLKLKIGDGYPKNRKEHLRLMKQSADKGYAKAQYEWGYICFHGSGVNEDQNEATKYFKMAADQHEPNGEYRYGYALYSGKGVSSKDYPKAAQYLQSAADQGICGAQYFYGYFLMRGLGIPKNLEEAERYLKLAADQGDKRAKEALRNLR